MPAGEVPSVRPADAAGAQPAERHATPRTVIDQRHVVGHPWVARGVKWLPERSPPRVGGYTPWIAIHGDVIRAGNRP